MTMPAATIGKVVEKNMRCKSAEEKERLIPVEGPMKESTMAAKAVQVRA
jgi:hypothetical protein